MQQVLGVAMERFGEEKAYDVVEGEVAESLGEESSYESNLAMRYRERS